MGTADGSRSGPRPQTPAAALSVSISALAWASERSSGRPTPYSSRRSPSRSARWRRAIVTIARTWLGVAGLDGRPLVPPGRVWEPLAWVGEPLTVAVAVDGGGVRRGGLSPEPGQFVVDRLVGRDVGVADPLVEPFEVVQEAAFELDLQVAGRADAGVLRQPELLRDADVEAQGHDRFLLRDGVSFSGTSRRGSWPAGLPGDVLELERLERRQGGAHEPLASPVTAERDGQPARAGLGVGQGLVQRLGLPDQRREAAGVGRSGLSGGRPPSGGGSARVFLSVTRDSLS